MLTVRVGDDDLRSLDVVQHWAQESLGRTVSRSEAHRIALRLAGAVLTSNADELNAMMGERGAQDSTTSDERAEVLAALAETEKAYRSLDGQVQRIGNNVNQLTRLGNVGEVVDPKALADVARALRDIELRMMLWERFDNRERARLMWDR